jgi:hypothetical protein
MTGTEAIQQVLVRLNEAANSPVAELVAGTGSASPATISTSSQILTWLNEGQDALAQSDMLQIRGRSTATVGAGAQQTLFSAMTPATTGQVLWLPLLATWAGAQIQVVDMAYQPIYYPDRGTQGTPVYAFVDKHRVIMGPRPVSSGTLVLEGFVLPVHLAVVGDSFVDVPDQLMPHVINWAAWQVCRKGIAEPALAAAEPIFRAEVAKFWPMAGGKK